MRIRWNWGTAMALVYSTFALATVAFVIFAIAHPAALVRDDYYRQSLAHDRRLEAAANVRALGASIGLTMETESDAAANGNGARIVLTLPASHYETARGTVTWYRASDASFDRVVPLAIDRSGLQRMPLDELQLGHWRLKVEWDAGGRPFYFERPITIAP